MSAKVLVQVLGGVAYVSAEGEVDVVVVDNDNDPRATPPVAFTHLDQNHPGIQVVS